MTAVEVSRVILVLSEALLDRGLRIEDRRSILLEVEEQLTAHIDGRDGA